MADNGMDEVAFESDEALLAEFLLWVKDAVTEMREIADALPVEVARDTEQVNRFYDLTHNIKGMGGSFDFGLMTSVGLSLCGHLKGMGSGTLIRSKVFASHTRAFEVILEHKIKGDGGEQGAALIQRLKGIIAEEVSSE